MSYNRDDFTSPAGVDAIQVSNSGTSMCCTTRRWCKPLLITCTPSARGCTLLKPAERTPRACGHRSSTLSTLPRRSSPFPLGCPRHSMHYSPTPSSLPHHPVFLHAPDNVRRLTFWGNGKPFPARTPGMCAPRFPSSRHPGNSGDYEQPVVG